MGSQTSCCNCNKDPTLKDSQINFAKDKEQSPSQRAKNSQRTSQRKNPYAPVKMSNRNVDLSIIENKQLNQSFGQNQVKIQVTPPQNNNNNNNLNDYLNVNKRDTNRSDSQKVSYQGNVFAAPQDNNLAANIVHHNKGYSVDAVAQRNDQQVPKSKTEVIQEAFNRVGISNNLNPRIVDNSWLNSFTVLKLLKKEIFSELYLIELNTNKEIRVLRKIKKVVFKDLSQGIEDFRFILGDELLQLEHPNITQLYDFKEDQYNFYLVLEYCKGGKLFEKIEELSEMTENLAAEICRQILSTIVYLHSKSHIYRNLSPDVLLLEFDDNIVDSFNLKLINIDVQNALAVAQQQFFATPLYFQSPESLNNQKITEKQDVWTCGVLLTILLTGEPPLQSDGSSNLMLRALLEGQFDFESSAWKEVSSNAVDFVKKLLDTDAEKRINAVTALNNKWLLNITKARRNNQRKILNQKVIQSLKKVIAELKFYQSVSDLLQQLAVNQDEDKILLDVFSHKDQTGEGDLKMDQIREAYTEFCGKFVEKEEIDLILEKCTVQVNKKGLIKYSQFVTVKSKKCIDACKNKIKNEFNVYDQKRNLGERLPYVKSGLLYKTEVKKLIGAIVASNNNQSENFLSDFDKDQDGYLTIEQVIELIMTIAKHL